MLKSNKKNLLIFFFSFVSLMLWFLFISHFFVKITPQYNTKDVYRLLRAFSFLSLAALCLLTYKNRLPRFIGIIYCLLLGLVSVMMVAIFIFYQKLDSHITIDDLYALMQTNVSEGTGYISTYMLSATTLLMGAGAFLISLILFWFLYLQFIKLPVQKIKPIIFCSFAAILTILAAISITRTTFFQFYKTTTQWYQDSISEFHEVFSDLENNLHIDKAEKKETGELYILIIGESQSRDAMSGYTGPIDNTPWLESIKNHPDWVVFNNAYSSHTNTIPSVPTALTSDRVLTGQHFPKAQNLISLSQSADIHTIWISNQIARGPVDSHVSAIAHLANENIFPNQLPIEPQPDEILIPHIQNTLKSLDPKKNNLIVIHLMGSHVLYDKRVPVGFPKVNVSKKKLVGKLVHDKWRMEMYNHYMTSINYTDVALSMISEEIIKNTSTPSFLIYLSDHSEDVFSRDGGHRGANYTWLKTRIPMFLWTSPAYQERYPEKVKQLQTHKNQIFTNDLLFDLYLGLANVETQSYRSDFDISHAEYSLSMDNAKTLLGQEIKTDNLLNTSLNAQIKKPHLILRHANTVFKARQAQGLGVQKLEVDLCISQQAQPQLLVGNCAQAKTIEMTLEEYLEKIKPSWELLWLNIHNLNEDNASTAYHMLDDLNHKYELKNKAIIESNHAKALAIFAESNWNTSFNISAFFTTKKKRRGLEATHFQEIKDRIDAHHIKGVSFSSLTITDDTLHKLASTLPQSTKFYLRHDEWLYSKIDLGKHLKDNYSAYLLTLDSPFDLPKK